MADALSEIQPDVGEQNNAAREGAANSAPSPGSGGALPGTTSSSGRPDLGWRLLAQLALEDTNSLMALVSQAESNTIPRIGWIGIAETLQSESLKQGLLTIVPAKDLLKGSEKLLIQRVDLIQILLRIAQNDASRKALTNALTQLNVQTVAEPARYSRASSGVDSLAEIPLPTASAQATRTQNSDVTWALITQIALRDDNALLALVDYADKNSKLWLDADCRYSAQPIAQGRVTRAGLETGIIHEARRVVESAIGSA